MNRLHIDSHVHLSVLVIKKVTSFMLFLDLPFEQHRAIHTVLPTLLQVSDLQLISITTSSVLRPHMFTELLLGVFECSCALGREESRPSLSVHIGGVVLADVALTEDGLLLGLMLSSVHGGLEAGHGVEGITFDGVRVLCYIVHSL